MKKIYIKPQAEVIKFGVATVICTSSLNLGSETTTDAGVTSADSREGIDWFDE